MMMSSRCYYRAEVKQGPLKLIRQVAQQSLVLLSSLKGAWTYRCKYSSLCYGSVMKPMISVSSTQHPSMLEGCHLTKMRLGYTYQVCVKLQFPRRKNPPSFRKKIHDIMKIEQSIYLDIENLEKSYHWQFSKRNVIYFITLQ